MKVLILGGAGYIGTVLAKHLIDQGDEVVVMDSFMYEKNPRNSSFYKIIVGDITNINDIQPAIEDADAIVNLAAISNDPAADLKPNLTWEINFRANEMISNLCKATNKRVIYASSCSVYGFSKTNTFTETSKLGPVTLYARTKMLSEKFYLDKDINGVVLRFATAYGYSEKPRFDLVVNTMIGTSFFEGKIIVNGGGQWRPIVHVKDVARAIYLGIHAQNPKYKIYNVGSNEQNYTIAQLAAEIKKELPNVEIIHNVSSSDRRSYKADFSRIKEDLYFMPNYSVREAIDEFYKAFLEKKITSMDVDEYYRVKYLKQKIYPKSLTTKIVENLRSIHIL